MNTRKENGFRSLLMSLAVFAMTMVSISAYAAPETITGRVVDANGYIDLTADYVREFDEKHYLAPIPTSQSVLNPEIGQNPGW